MTTTTLTPDDLHRAGYRLTYVEGLAVVARFTPAGVPVVLRRATAADRAGLCYRPDPRTVAAQRAAWDRLAATHD